MEMPYGRAEEDTLPDIEKKSPAVRKERLHLECRGEAVDEGTLVQQGRPVIKEPAVPVYPLIACQREQSGGKKHVPAPVREEREETARLRSELLLGNGRLLVGIVFLHVVRTDHPARAVTVVAAQGHPDLEIPSQVPYVLSEVIHAAQPQFKPRLPGQVALGGNLARPKGQEGAHCYKQILSHGITPLPVRPPVWHPPGRCSRYGTAGGVRRLFRKSPPR